MNTELEKLQMQEEIQTLESEFTGFDFETTNISNGWATITVKKDGVQYGNIRYKLHNAVPVFYRTKINVCYKDEHFEEYGKVFWLVEKFYEKGQNLLNYIDKIIENAKDKRQLKYEQKLQWRSDNPLEPKWKIYKGKKVNTNHRKKLELGKLWNWVDKTYLR